MIKEVLRDSAIYGAASILSRGLSLLVLPIYTRVLGPADFGALDMIMTFGALANLVVAFEVSQGLARYWPDCETAREKKRLASSVWWFSIAMYSLFLVCALCWADWINKYLLGEVRLVPVLRIGIVFVCFNGIFSLLQNQFRWELRSKDYAVISLIYSFLTLGLGAFFSYGLGLGLMGILWGQTAATAISLGVAWWKLRESFLFEIDFEYLRRMLNFSIPLVPSALATFISLYINRLTLNAMGSLGDVGLFGIGNRIASIITLLIIGIQGALTPLIYLHYQDPNTPKNLAKLLEWFLALALLGCLFLGLFSQEILAIFATNAYRPGAALVVFLAPALLLTQMYIFAPGMAIKKKTYWQLGITVVTALVSTALNIILVPLWGALGAAMATLAAAIVFLGLWVCVSQRLYPVPFRWKSICVAISAFAACAVIGRYADLISFGFGGAIALKVVLQFFVLPATIVVSGLISSSELSQGINKLRNRFAS